MTSPPSSRESSKDASGPQIAPDPHVGTILGERYRLSALVGEGGMGRVYAAEHVLMRKRVAVKILHRELTRLPDVVRRFEREAMAAANIDHPNIAAATDFGHVPDGALYLVLEYVQGQSLRVQIDEGPIPEARALHITRQIVSALGSAHAIGIVHRDLKPENVMLVNRGGDPDFVKVLDFGIAKVPVPETSDHGSTRPGPSITKVGMVFGTPEYMAPEQALGQDVDGRCDLYGVGIILFEMLTQRRPYSASSAVALLAQQLSVPCPAVAERAPAIVVSPGVDALLARLLTADREARFRTAAEVLDAIDCIDSGRPPLLAEPRNDEAEARMSAAQPSAMASTIPAPPSMKGDARGAWLAVLLAPFSRVIEQNRPVWPRQLDQFSTKALSLAALGMTASVVVLGLAAVVAATLAAGGGEDGGGDVAVAESTARRASRVRVGTSPRELDGTRASQVVEPAASNLDSAPSASNAEAEPVRATEVELALARAGGVDSLRRLMQRVKGDVVVVVELARAQAQTGDSVGAVASVAQALAVDPRVSKSADVATLLWTTVQKRESSDATFTLLEGAMGERGVDILYDLVTTEGIRKEIRTRAESFFQQRRHLTNGSPGLQVLVEFREAATCEARASLLDRVLRDGDSRIIPLLQASQTTTGCGPEKLDDCYPCLRGGRLEAVLSTIKNRSHGS